MTDVQNIVKLAVDAYKGQLTQYSYADSQETIRQALIEANNGSTKLDYRAVRDGKCGGLFALLETILSNIVVGGLTGDEFFNALVDYRNVAEGDEPVFVVEDSIMFVVDDTADGTQGTRRQRIGGSTEVTIPTSLKTIRIYEELNRVLAGRVDFNALIQKVADAMTQKIREDIYTLWMNATSTDFGGITYFPAAGAYNADTLLTLIAHVEAAAGGKPATIIGTKKACRKLVEAVQSDSAKEELHNLGFYGRFYGTPVVAMPQRHKIGSTDFVYDDDILTIIAGDDKPIKFVYEGDPLIIMGDPLKNADLTQELEYALCA